ARPLTVQHLLARADGAPDHFARVLVHRDQTWSERRWDARMAFILAVGSTDHEQITQGQHVAIAGFMWKDTQGGHVQLPDDVCCSVAFQDLFAIWTIVLTVTETLRIEA